MSYPYPEKPVDRALDMAVYDALSHYETSRTEVMRLIEAGGDPNLMIEGGTSLIWRTVNPLRKSFHNKGLRALLGDLLESGANPFLNDHILDKDLINKEPNVVLLMLTKMAQLEDAGLQRYRDGAGSNALHTLCATKPIWLGSVLQCCSSGREWTHTVNNQKNMSLSVQLSKSWISEARHQDGKTPLHVLLDGEDQRLGVWRSAQCLLQLGASVNIKDHTGQTISDLMDSLAIAKISAEEEKVLDILRMSVQSRALEAWTSATSRIKSSSRL